MHKKGHKWRKNIKYINGISIHKQELIEESLMFKNK